MTYHGLGRTTHKHLWPSIPTRRVGWWPIRRPTPQELLDPETLVLAHYQDADADTQLVDWEAFQSHLGEVTGKKVVGQEYLNSADDVAAIKAGNIHVVALHAADVPYVVNNAGFIPFAVLGTEAGAHGNHLDIAVPAKSKIRSLNDLRGRTLTCTTPDSITGYRAAIAVLSQEAGMRPDVDYSINFSFGQKRSVLGLASGEFEVAALSDDKLQSMLEKGSVSASDFRIVYESQVIPRLTIGYAQSSRRSWPPRSLRPRWVLTTPGGRSKKEANRCGFSRWTIARSSSSSARSTTPSTRGSTSGRSCGPSCQRSSTPNPDAISLARLPRFTRPRGDMRPSSAWQARKKASKRPRRSHADAYRVDRQATRVIDPRDRRHNVRRRCDLAAMRRPVGEKKQRLGVECKPASSASYEAVLSRAPNSSTQRDAECFIWALAGTSCFCQGSTMLLNATMLNCVSSASPSMARSNSRLAAASRVPENSRPVRACFRRCR